MGKCWICGKVWKPTDRISTCGGESYCSKHDDEEATKQIPKTWAYFREHGEDKPKKDRAYMERSNHPEAYYDKPNAERVGGLLREYSKEKLAEIVVELETRLYKASRSHGCSCEAMRQLRERLERCSRWCLSMCEQYHRPKCHDCPFVKVVSKDTCKHDFRPRCTPDWDDVNKEWVGERKCQICGAITFERTKPTKEGKCNAPTFREVHGCYECPYWTSNCDGFYKQTKEGEE